MHIESRDFLYLNTKTVDLTEGHQRSNTYIYGLHSGISRVAHANSFGLVLWGLNGLGKIED